MYASAPLEPSTKIAERLETIWNDTINFNNSNTKSQDKNTYLKSENRKAKQR